MAAVADPPVDTIISQPHRIVQFTSRRSELVLVHTPEYPILGPQGQKVGRNTDGVRIPFKDGMLKVPEEGHVTSVQGRKFPADELLVWLRDHPRFGDHDDGFWEVPSAAPAVAEGETEAMMMAAARGDRERLVGLLSAEENGWNRPDLTRPIRKAIEQLDEMTAHMEAQQAAAAAKAASKPAAKA